MTKHSKYYYETDRNMPYSPRGLDDYLEKTSEIDPYETTDTKQTHKPYDKVITLKVSQETFEAWELLKENWGDVIGYDNDSKIFEFAIIEALNIPIASLGGFKM